MPTTRSCDPSQPSERHQRALAIRAAHGLGDPAADPELTARLGSIICHPNVHSEPSGSALPSRPSSHEPFDGEQAASEARHPSARQAAS